MAAYLLYLNASPCYLRLKALLEILTWYPKRYSADTGREKNTPVSQNLHSWFQAEHPLEESRTDGLRRGGQECASCQQLSFLGGSWVARWFITRNGLRSSSLPLWIRYCSSEVDEIVAEDLFLSSSNPHAGSSGLFDMGFGYLWL